MFKFSHDFDSNQVIGYYAYFKLLNGFKKTLYMTKAQVEAHAKKYSKSYTSNRATNLWRDSFDFMASKTVLKLLLNRYAPLSIEMQRAFKADQAVVGNDLESFDYVDNDTNNETEKVVTSTTRKAVSNSFVTEEKVPQQNLVENSDEKPYDPFDDDLIFRN